jgi:hypothetical protein
VTTTEQQWNRTIALIEAELDKANADLETAREESRRGDPFAPDYADIQEGELERVKAAREHRDHIGRDLKRAMQQRDRALGKRLA